MSKLALHDLELPGCSPEPLMNYLKALGILRLVSEQKDEGVRVWWKGDAFWLRSQRLGPSANEVEERDELVRFFIEEYAPTPILAPWNAGSGFFLKWDEKGRRFKSREASDALEKVVKSDSPRFAKYRDQILAVKKLLAKSGEHFDPDQAISQIRDRGRQEKWAKKKVDEEVKKLLDSRMLLTLGGTAYAIEKSEKDEFLREIRSSLADELLRWIDATFVFRTGQKKNRVEAPLLGSGGNIGNSDFSARFAQLFTLCLPIDHQDPVPICSEELLRNALFGELTSNLIAVAVDQFDPGRAGGANMYQGLEAAPRLNPWDYVLMIEGAILLRSGTSKRLASYGSSASFPFTVAGARAGFASAGADEARAEQWLPLWNRACSAAEVVALFAEGRSQLGARSARDGIDFARAASSLGVDRGIKQFVRIQYQPRLGDNYLANVLGRFDVVSRESVDLLREADGWLASLRLACSGKNVPPRIASALRRVDSAIFEFCRYGGADRFQQIVTAFGRAERELSAAERFREEHKLRPVPELSAGWARAADDRTPEFALARALASIEPEGRVGPLRANLESADWKKQFRAWAERDRSVVWGAGDSATNLLRVLERRIMDGERVGCESLPLASSDTVSLGAISAFISGDVDDERIEDLLWGLTLVSPENSAPSASADDTVLPREYALLKLLFLPRPLMTGRRGDRVRWRLARNGESGIRIRPEPRILSLLRSARVGEACKIAAQRLRSSGLIPLPGSLPTGVTRDAEWNEGQFHGRDAYRLGAALLLPISSASVGHLAHLACREQSAAAEAFAVSTAGETNE